MIKEKKNKKLYQKIIEIIQDKTHEFDETLYSNKSIKYGSYVLKKEYSKNLSIAAIASFSIFFIFIVGWFFITTKEKLNDIQDKIDIIDFKNFDVTVPPIPKELLEPKLATGQKLDDNNKILEKKSKKMK